VDMAMEGKFDGIKGNQYHGDPSMPSFRFSEQERAQKRKDLMAQGLTEAEANVEIVLQESTIMNKQAQAKIEKEGRGIK